MAKQIKYRAAERACSLLKDLKKWVHFQFEKPMQKPQVQIAVGGSIQWEKLNLCKYAKGLVRDHGKFKLECFLQNERNVGLAPGSETY